MLSGQEEDRDRESPGIVQPSGSPFFVEMLAAVLGIGLARLFLI